MRSVLEDVREKKERRNTSMNLAWTGPCDNSSLQTNISYEKVANMAIDMFCNTSKAASAGDANASVTPAPAEGEENETLENPKATLHQVMESQGARPWNIPATVEKGFKIPSGS